MKKLIRKHKNTIVDALTQAQKLIFAPIAFQALSSMLDFGIIKLIGEKPSSEKDIIDELRLDEYAVRTLLQVGILNNILKCDDEIYSLTKTGEMFLYDNMTMVNFNYVKDVCYLAASELTKSFASQKPEGLYKFVGNYPTIYPALSKLPNKMQKSWYAFDHMYSDNCFEEVFSMISQKYNSIYDIGGNTGKFEKLCLSHNKNFDITMLDLKENIDLIKTDIALKNCNFYPIDVLEKKPNYPKIQNSAVLMSQFLDCFSKPQIIKILSDLKNVIDEKSSIYILELYTDMQNFEGAKYALCHTSLYFTCMANGVSKFYTLCEMKDLIEKAGLHITLCKNNIGPYDYTLLECKNAVV